MGMGNHHELRDRVVADLRAMGFSAMPEFSIKTASGRTARVDVAIFEHDELAAIIEIKTYRRGRSAARRWWGTKQAAKYRSLGVPVRLVYGENHWAAVQAELFTGCAQCLH